MENTDSFGTRVIAYFKLMYVKLFMYVNSLLMYVKLFMRLYLGF